MAGNTALDSWAVQCWAKTTSSRSKAASSSDSTSAQQPLQQQQPLSTNSSKSVQDRLGGVSQRLQSLVHFLTPKQEGDIGDVLMMSLSMAVLIFFSMQLYRLYAYAYFHAGSYQTMMDMMQ
ncbi:hypothetical protein OEZ86_011438 [Tetradesmus obliquus]|nr:hypothetical protein OEZ86_011438 [Tetradesmus obliquus]